MPTPPSNAFPNKEYFEAPICRNCGAEMTREYCPECGQEKVERISLSNYVSDLMDTHSDFEFDMAGALLRLITKPGKVALEYVKGARTKHLNPLKLLFIAIVILLIVLEFTNPEPANPSGSRAMEIIQTYSQLAFSVGVIAIFFASYLTFRWKRPYNILEHMTLALYTHVVVLLANCINQLTFLLTDQFVTLAAHRTLADYYMEWIETGIVLWAFIQFFNIRLKREWWKLIIAAALFVGLKKTLIFGFAWSLVKIVIAYLR